MHQLSKLQHIHTYVTGYYAYHINQTFLAKWAGWPVWELGRIMDYFAKSQKDD